MNLPSPSTPPAAYEAPCPPELGAADGVVRAGTSLPYLLPRAVNGLVLLSLAMRALDQRDVAIARSCPRCEQMYGAMHRALLTLACGQFLHAKCDWLLRRSHVP